MNRMTQQNLDHIKERFSNRTGVELSRNKTFRGRKMVLLLAAVIASFLLAAFAYPHFTPLDGDALVLQGRYRGNGMVTVYVENGSDKDLIFQKQVKLMCRQTGREVPRLTGRPQFESICFPGDSSGIMTIDLSETYDMSVVEQEDNGSSYYLLLTNNGFLFGHDWMCSISFREEESALTEKELTEQGSCVELPDAVEESLRFYFEETYQDEVFAWEEAHGIYLQKVDELLAQADGDVISPVSPTVLVSGPSELLEPHPQIDTRSMPDSETEWTALDGYSRLIGAGVLEKALVVTAKIPYEQYPESYDMIPIRYLFVYETARALPENRTFLYGRLFSFEELEAYRVSADAYYRIYDITDLLYTDLEAYLIFLQNTRPDLIMDQENCQKIRDIYDYYQKSISEHIHYLDKPEAGLH